MTARSPVSVLSELRMIGAVGDAINGEDLGILLEHRRHEAVVDRDGDLSIYRSGSAPPTVEGSLAAVGGLLGTRTVSEEDFLSDPAYLSYYYSNANLNPRLPPPTLSKEDWRFTQRLQAGRSVAVGVDLWKASHGVQSESNSLFSMQPTFGSIHKGGDAIKGNSGLPLVRQKSFAEIFKDDLGQTSSTSAHLSRPSSRNTFNAGKEPIGTSQMFTSISSLPISRPNASDPPLISRNRSPCLPPVGSKLGFFDKNSNTQCSFGSISSAAMDSDSLVDSFRGLELSPSAEHHYEFNNHEKFLGEQNSSSMAPSLSSMKLPLRSDVPDLQGSDTISSSNLSSKTHFSSASSQGYGLSGYAFGPDLAMMMMKTSSGLGTQFYLHDSNITAPAMDSRVNGGFMLGYGNHAAGSALLDAQHAQYLKNSDFSAQNMANFSENPLENGYLGNSYVDTLGIQKAYLESLQQQKQYSLPYFGKFGSLANGYYNNSNFSQGLTLPYSRSSLESPVFASSPAGHGSSRHKYSERETRYSSGIRNLAANSWYMNSNGGMVDLSVPSLLEEFKSNKAKCSELSDIAGHIVEFSADQYGSRFIQQKLETATTEEKDMVFEEIMPHALSLMTDVFGNYVVQKLFEHGAKSQIHELAIKLSGHVLTLSLQMYGCRVIQKAVEVVDFDQKTKMVVELDGHVMRCVRDQNGNHVIQKCIECIPEESIQFLISTFYDQVVMLSTHPYGCRVIQRVLEHCKDPKTQKIVMDEIMKCVYMLAQDQYGNYVVQHVLQFGKPDERSAIIKKLSGHIVQMSQQKFASNVVEKCLSFGGPEERRILVSEMLGSTEENEPLQAMMKDQFANYVVQKVLETCDDWQRELILSRIKVHLNTLKKYTYGKHIVARVEKLVAAGERRIGIQSS